MKTLLTLIALISTTVVCAQSGKNSLDSKKFKTIDNSLFECIYEYNIQNKTKSGDAVKETYSAILQVGASVSKFWDYSVYAHDSIVHIVKDAPQSVKLEYEKRVAQKDYFFEPTIFQNFPKNKITVNDLIVPNKFVYTEDNGIFEWQLHQDTLTVCENLCHKATASYGGRDWTVWYAPAIPSGYGPWKFSNLPGLILQAEDSQGIHQFKAIAIRKNSLPIYTENNIQRLKTSREKFIQNKNKFEENPMGNVMNESINNMLIKYTEGGKRNMFINDMLLRVLPNGYVPLEVN